MIPKTRHIAYANWGDIVADADDGVAAVKVTIASAFEDKQAWMVKIDGDYYALRLPPVPASFSPLSVPANLNLGLHRVLIHRIGELKDAEWLDTFVADNTGKVSHVMMGRLVQLPPHAHMSTYDVGDQAVVTMGRRQGEIGTVTGCGSDGVTLNQGAHHQSVAHRLDAVAAIFPHGDMSRYEDIMPGVIKYPPGTLVWALGERWIVVRWVNGRADVQSLEGEDRRAFKKAQLALGG